MNTRKFFVTGIAKTVSLALNFVLWLAIFMALAWGIRHRPAQQYAEGNEISPLFAVAVRNTQGEIQAQPLNPSPTAEPMEKQRNLGARRHRVARPRRHLPATDPPAVRHVRAVLRKQPIGYQCLYDCALPNRRRQ